MKKRKKVIVVGGGIAGLTASAYLARKGHNVKLFEKHEKCGGLVNTFDYQGFKMEGGVRALVNAGVVTPMLENLGVEIETLKNPVSIGIEKDIIHVQGEEDLQDYERLLKSKYPESKDDIDRFIGIVKEIIKHMKILYGVKNPLFIDMKREGIATMGKYLPWLFKFLRTVQKINEMKEPIESYSFRILRNSSLRDIVIQHFFRGTPSFFALSYFYLYTDYFYPEGGVGVLSEKLAQKCTELGGEIFTGNPIRKVIPGRNMVIDDKGDAHEYDALIWATDLKAFYNSIDATGLDGGIVKKLEAEKRKIMVARGAESVLTVYLGVDEPVETFGKIAHGHFFHTPSKQGLGEIHRSKLKQIIEQDEQTGKAEIRSWLEDFFRFNTYEISIPALRYKPMAPEGKTGLIVSVLMDYDLIKKIDDDGWYEEFKQYAENLVVENLTESVYPFLKDRLIFRFTSTPLTIERMYGSSDGSIIGWSFERSLPVPSSMFSMKASVKTPVQNIYRAGKWVYAPAGVPTAIITGKLAADMVK